MNLPRVLNTVADTYTALRRAGWDADEAQRIVLRAFHESLDTLYPKQSPKPYHLTPREEQELHDEYNRYHSDPSRNQ